MEQNKEIMFICEHCNNECETKYKATCAKCGKVICDECAIYDLDTHKIVCPDCW